MLLATLWVGVKATSTVEKRGGPIDMKDFNPNEDDLGIVDQEDEEHDDDDSNSIGL